MTTDDLIQAFGGREAVALVTGAKPNAITQWRYTGVPHRHWPALIEAANERHVSGVDFSSLQSTRPVASDRPEATA